MFIKIFIDEIMDYVCIMKQNKNVEYKNINILMKKLHILTHGPIFSF
jgi:hypothetical protein